MPTYDSLGPDNGYGVKNARTATIEPNEQGTAGPAQLHPARRALLQNIELMPQNQDFSFEPLARLEAVAQHADDQKGNCHHRPRSCSDSVMAATPADRVFGSDSGQNDWCVCTTWFVHEKKYYLVDVLRGRFDYPTLR